MKYPCSMSVIVVQRTEDEAPYVPVLYDDDREAEGRVFRTMYLPLTADATDAQMWAQMMAARVCDAL